VRVPLFGGRRLADLEGQVTSIGKAQAVIEFGLDGTIRTANENFLKAVGYSLAEIRGQHHSMFVDPASRDSAEDREFWAKLGRGHYAGGEYRRIAKGGREVWSARQRRSRAARREQALEQPGSLADGLRTADRCETRVSGCIS
jgi:PAS domain S-box-containing protein